MILTAEFKALESFANLTSRLRVFLSSSPAASGEALTTSEKWWPAFSVRGRVVFVGSIAKWKCRPVTRDRMRSREASRRIAVARRVSGHSMIGQRSRPRAAGSCRRVRRRCLKLIHCHSGILGTSSYLQRSFSGRCRLGPSYPSSEPREGVMPLSIQAIARNLRPGAR